MTVAKSGDVQVAGRHSASDRAEVEVRPRKKWMPTRLDQRQDRADDPAHAFLASLCPGNQEKGPGVGWWNQSKKPSGRNEGR